MANLYPFCFMAQYMNIKNSNVIKNITFYSKDAHFFVASMKQEMTQHNNNVNVFTIYFSNGIIKMAHLTLFYSYVPYVNKKCTFVEVSYFKFRNTM